MNFHILTLFPEMVMQGLNTSIIGRACEKGLLSVNAVNIRDFTTNKHKKVDDYPYGGGAGMLMQAQPVYDAYLHVVDNMKKELDEAGYTQLLEGAQWDLKENGKYYVILNAMIEAPFRIT